MRTFPLLGIVALALWAGVATASEPVRVLSIQPNDTHACVATLVRLQPTESLAGVRWLNNDGEAPLARILLLEGQDGVLPDLAATGVVVENLGGDSAAWAEAMLVQPVVSTTRVVYVVFVFPSGTATTGIGEGGGSGIGVRSSSNGTPFLISADGLEWVAFGPRTQLMVEPILESSLGKTARPAAFLSTLAARVRYRAEGKPVVDLPTRTAIEGVAPNPFNPATEIRYALAEPCEALLGIYNVRGQRVATLLQSEQPAGRYVAVWHGTDDGSVGVASGVYFARLEACGEQFTHRLALIR